MKNCILCHEPTEHPSFDFCKKCFAMTIEEIEQRYLNKRASETRQDHREAQNPEDFCESSRPI